MKLTLKFKLPRDPDIEETISKYSMALNYVSTTEFGLGNKIINPITLSKKYYYDVREKFGLPAQHAQSLFRDLASKYKQIRTTKCKLKKAIHFNSTFFSIVRNRNFTFDYKKNLFKITTINGRKTYTIHFSNYHKQYLNKDTQYCDSTVSIDRKRNKLYLNLSIELPDTALKDKGETMGIDLGLTKLATCCTNKGKTLVISGGKIKDHRNKFLNLRKRLQHKGTRSAKKLLRNLSGKENRWMRDVNYCAVKSILQFAKENNISHIGIEDLTNIRGSAKKLRKETRKEINSWAFYQFKEILIYKAKMEGINVILVNPEYTSQACSKCGYTDKNNRKTQKHFKCCSCNFSQNADINAASNIELLTRTYRFNNMSWGVINHPDVTNVDSKGLFRQLRTSLNYKLTSLSSE